MSMDKRLPLLLAAALLLGAAVLLDTMDGGDGNGGTEMWEILPATSQGGFLRPTMELRELSGGWIPVQNGMPVPSFEPQRRLTMPLGGEWRKERFDSGNERSMAPRSREWVTLVEAESGGRTGESYEDSAWAATILPRPENTMTDEESPSGAEHYENGVWYRRAFELGKEWNGKAVTLKSLGINYVCDIWINGKWAGYHEGGFTPFALDVTPLVKEGANTIVIRVDNPPWGSRIDTIPAIKDTDFFNYTGVIQDLYLEAAPYAYLARLDVVPLDEQGTIRVKAVVENRSDQAAAVTLTGSLFEAVDDLRQRLASPYADTIIASQAESDGWEEREVALKAREIAAISWDVRIRNPNLWDMEHPNLYVAELKLASGGKEEDGLTTQFGIRTLKTEGSQILLNGNPVFLRGIARHEEWPLFGRTAEWKRIADDLLQIRGLYASMVRTAHYPNHVYTYLLTDRIGLAAMSEIPLWQFETIHYETQEKKRLSDQMWREMIFSQYNRPSVLMWSTQNESKDVLLRKAYNERLVRDSRERYDDGRLITQSAAADQPGAHDESMEPLDVASWTMYFGIFHGGEAYEGTKRFLEETHLRWPDKPILNTEYGYWSREDNSEADTQVRMYEETLRALLEKSAVDSGGRARPDGFLAGIDYWPMYNWYVNHGQWVQTMGLYHMDRETEKPVKLKLERDYAAIAGIKGR
ncbi:glycoside hydrolase family 2 TIM barrel-domain containing protein [Paenibacillus sp. LHD-117]|uniref:glycoside hydrolase family 2 TIM barrel-domain containing protein n=1 Tax=Paenibacillus sp. LHD-117 TaxID=3071412 RepID=UPI0027E16260|nr:glycoside hydrolase family 2 TIM barrel-domain containing protein [Paenibacillus sp. LHD-117]MDQ6421565.1 glycoside hydrolase family 2 TIM barrel-domain containing protein [Paenibacillus sp. LHD-117]